MSLKPLCGSLTFGESNWKSEKKPRADCSAPILKAVGNTLGVSQIAYFYTKHFIFCAMNAQLHNSNTWNYAIMQCTIRKLKKRSKIKCGLMDTLHLQQLHNS